MGQAYSYQAAGSDPNGDPLTWSLPTKPTGMTINAAGLISWTPSSGQVGNHNCTLNLSDGQVSASQSWTIVVSPAAGGGAEATSGRRVVVHYTGWLYEPSAADKKGAKFDSSRDRNEPFEFSLGAGEVIRGWDEGVKGMKVGGKRVLTIPPEMGYGARGAGGVIPPNATLLFEVELLDVR